MNANGSCVHGHSLDDAYRVRDGLRIRHRCRPCQKAANRAWYAANKDRISAVRRAMRLARMGIRKSHQYEKVATR